jgi:histone H3/H4
MELDEFADEMAKKHIARSLEDMRDPQKNSTWKISERAREQAQEIAEALVKDIIEQGEKNAG